MTKQQQTHKNKQKSDKKLPPKELQQYQFWLEKNHPICQANIGGCEHKAIEAHHVLFGCYGADKDDKTQISVCRSCHEWCHAHKANSQELFLHVARKNWKDFGGSEDIDNG